MDNINDSCDNPMFSGMDSRAIIFNYNDLKKLASDVEEGNNRIIKKFTFNTGTNPYYIINARTNPYTGTNTAVEVGDYRNTFTRTVSLFVPMDGAAASQAILDPLANGRFVVVLHNNFVNDLGDNEYQVYGYDRGLVVSSMTQTKYENNDYWVVELQEAGVPNSGKFLVHNEEVPVTEGVLTTAVLVNAESSTGVYNFQYTVGDITNVIATYDFTSDDYHGEIGTEFHVTGLSFTFGGEDYVMDVDITTLGDGNNGTVSNIRHLTNTTDYICSLLPVEE
jgi:hypothetical protein